MAEKRRIQFEYLEDRCLLAAIQMTAQEQLLLELINRARANPAAEAARIGVPLNQDLEADQITTDPKQPLSPNQQLITAARGHAQDMLDLNFFGHENPFTNKGPSDRAQDAGYPRGAGENIAWYGSTDPMDRNQQVYDRHEALYISSGHRVNFFNPGWRELGNGIKYGLYTDSTSERPTPLQSIMVAENFGNRGGNAFITGVAYTDEVRPDNFYTIGEGIGGMTVTAIRNSDGATFTVQTGPSGGYGLQVSPGIYSLTARKTGVHTFEISNVFVDGANEKVDFNTRIPGFGSVRGIVFSDLNENGRQDNSEPGLANQSVYIDEAVNDILDSHETVVTTDSDGNFTIIGLRPDEYHIRLSHPAERPLTVPSVLDLYNVTVRAGVTKTKIDFGLASANQAPIAVDDFVETRAGTSITINVTANDSDVDGALDLRTVEVVAGPVNENAQVRVDRSNGNIVYTPQQGFTGPDALIYTIKDDRGLESQGAQVDILVTPGVGRTWQNSANKFDVNNDGTLSARDVLLIVLDINQLGPRTLSNETPAPPPFIDSSGDGSVSAIDALIVTIEINRQLAAAAEGEFDNQIAAAVSGSYVELVSVSGLHNQRLEPTTTVDQDRAVELAYHQDVEHAHHNDAIDAIHRVESHDLFDGLSDDNLAAMLS